MSLDLFKMVEESARARLLASPLGAMLADEIGVDTFCGGGGATQGIEDAGLVVHECVNHSEVAIATHAKNHPGTRHHQSDVFKSTPRALAAGRRVGLLWASPDCRHFSRARGAAPVNGPLNAIHAGGNNFGLIAPVVQAFRGNAAPKSVNEPLPGITAGSGPGRGAGAGHALGLITPLLMSAGGPECKAVPAGEPMDTVLPRDHRALITPLLMHNTTHHTGGRVNGPVPTVTTGGNTGVVVPLMAYMNHGGKQSGPVDGEPMRTVVSGGGHAALVAALLVSFYGNSTGGHRADKPLGTVTTLDRHGLVCVMIDGAEFVIVDILFRMLKPRELAAAMGFPASYIWPATHREAVRLIGNAVSPPQAEALVRANFPRGLERTEGRAVA